MTIPIASILVTSSYVRVPAILTLPLNDASPINVETPDAFKNVVSTFNAVSVPPIPDAPFEISIPVVVVLRLSDPL